METEKKRNKMEINKHLLGLILAQLGKDILYNIIGNEMKYEEYHSIEGDFTDEKVEVIWEETFRKPEIPELTMSEAIEKIGFEFKLKK